MNGTEWMEKLLTCDSARQRIPLELQATLPLPGRQGAHSAECWYYRMECRSAGPLIYSPERYVLWDIQTMTILKLDVMSPKCLGSGADVLTRAHREKEDAFLNGVFTEFLQNGESMMKLGEVTNNWLAAAPQEMREWLRNILKEVC